MKTASLAWPRFALLGFLTLLLAACATITILEQPRSLSVAAGQQAVFTVVAQSSAAAKDPRVALHYQWYRGNKKIHGATGASYALLATAADNGAKFRVVVSDEVGDPVSSDWATLTVTAGGGLVLQAGSLGGAGNLDGSGSNARFFGPAGTALDAAGNVYVADAYNYAVRKITPAGVVSTLAGLPGTSGYANGTGSAARFGTPVAIALDSSGNVYVTDLHVERYPAYSVIRKITPAGVVSTLAGYQVPAGPPLPPRCNDGAGSTATFGEPQGLTVGPDGTLYVADTNCFKLRQITPDGTVSTLASGLGNPMGVVRDSSGNFYVADVGSHVIRKVTGSSSTVFAGGLGQYGNADGTTGATGTARFMSPVGLALDGNGDLYVTDGGNHTVRKISGGVVSTLAGTAGSNGTADGSGAAARFYQPAGISRDAAGNLYVGDFLNNTVRKISAAGSVSTLAGLGAILGASDGTGSAATFNFSQGSAMARDASGNLYIADTVNSVIRKVTPAGVVSTLAGTAGVNGTSGNGTDDDGVGSAARFNHPRGITVAPDGNIYVSDTGSQRIRRITPAGVVTTPMTSNYTLFYLEGIAVAADGTIYVIDQGNSTVVRVDSDGNATIFAGTRQHQGSADGVGINASFSAPDGLVLDASGSTLYVADSGNGTIRKIDVATAQVSTLAGTAGVIGHADGTGAAASFNINPALTVSGGGLSLDDAGNLILADTSNGTVRRITPAGVVTTLAGVAGKIGNLPNATPPLLGPTQAAVVVGNSLYVTSAGGALIRGNLP